eukprot:gene13839-biopygen117
MGLLHIADIFLLIGTVQLPWRCRGAAVAEIPRTVAGIDPNSSPCLPCGIPLRAEYRYGACLRYAVRRPQNAAGALFPPPPPRPLNRLKGVELVPLRERVVQPSLEP